MKPFVLGVGRGGCRVANLFLTSEKPSTGILMDTEESDVRYFPYKHKMLLGERLTDGNGTGGDLELGREIMEGEKYRIVERIDAIRGEMDCLLVVAGLGGGTGGAVDVLAEELRRSFSEPVYCIGIMPSESEPRNLINFSEGFKRVVGDFHAIFPIDNDRLRDGRRLRTWYNHMNMEIYRHMSELFRIGEYHSKDDLGGNVVTASDVTNTLNGLSSVGIGSYPLREERSGLFTRRYEEISKPELVVSLTEKAVKACLLPFKISDARKALVVVSGPRRYLDFMGSIPARLWVEKNIGGVEVRGGDIPDSGKKDLEVMVTLSGIKRSGRIKFLYQMGRMLKNRNAYSERLSSIFDRLKALDAKINDLEGDFKAIYEDMKGIVREPENNEKKGLGSPAEREEDLYSGVSNLERG
jgi:cell division GTPase FtsZ